MSTLSAKHGNTIPLDITATLAGDAFSLTGCSIAFTVHRTPYTTALLTLAIGTGITVTDAAGGLATATITDDQSALLPPDVPLFYKVNVITGAGETYTIDSGYITLSKA